MTEEVTITSSDDVALRGHLLRAKHATEQSPALVLCHGFPAEARGAESFGQTYPELAERISEQGPWSVLTFDFRGTGRSEGNFSLGGWLNDVKAALDYLGNELQTTNLWLCGFGTGGALCVFAAAEDTRVRGVAALGAPSDFGEWASNPERCLERARSTGAIRDESFPADFEAWTRELAEIRPVAVIGKLPPRPILIVHGSDDETVPLLEARGLADAADNQVELRVVNGAQHDLRHDPRAIAVLMGWLERQTSASASTAGDDSL